MKNLEMLTHYINGTRPYVIVNGGVQGLEQPNEHKIGETWSDDKGFVYEQKDGYRIKCTRMGSIIREASENKKVCVDCGLDTRWSKDKKNNIINIENRCYDCYLTFESRLRIQGKFKDFQRKRIIQSQKSYLMDIKTKLEESIKYLTNETSIEFVNSTGLVEYWKIDDKKEMLEFLEKELNICKNYITEADILLNELKNIEE